MCEVLEDHKKKLVSELDLLTLKDILFPIVKHAKESVHYYWTDYSDADYCSFCNEDEHTKQCFSFILNNSIKKNNISFNNFNSICIRIADGFSYSTCCNHMYINCCSFCGSHTKHEYNCAQQQMILALGDIYSNLNHNIAIKKEQLINIEKNKIQQQRDKLKMLGVKNQKKQLENNKLKWKKIAKEQNKDLCPFCFKPFSNLEHHLSNSLKCKK